MSLLVLFLTIVFNKFLVNIILYIVIINIVIIFRSCPNNKYSVEIVIPMYPKVMINDEIEKPKIKLLRYSKNILKGIPIMVRPNIQIIVIYERLIMMLFLNAESVLMLLVLIFVMNKFILSITRFLLLISMILEKIAPEIIPKNNTVIINIFIL